MSLDWNGKNLMSMYVDKSMENENEIVLIEGGSECIMTIRNTIGDTEGNLCDKILILNIHHIVRDEANIKQTQL